MDRLKQQCDNILLALLGSQELVDNWWRGNNKAFDNNAPISIYEKNPMRIKEYLFAQVGGEYL
jgi:hypothetical protein